MRILALVLLAALPFSALAQKKGELSWPAMELDPSTNLITYSGVPEVAGATAADLYDRAFKWGARLLQELRREIKKARILRIS